MSSGYDVIVIGGGSPGEHCAGALAEGGLRVATVEHESVGGDCSYWACIQSKTLLRSGEAVHVANDAAAAAQVAYGWPSFTKPIQPANVKELTRYFVRYDSHGGPLDPRRQPSRPGPPRWPQGSWRLALLHQLRVAALHPSRRHGIGGLGAYLDQVEDRG